MATAEAPRVNTLFEARPSVVWAEALGSNVLDVDGNRYLDATSGFGAAAVGHRHPRVAAAVRAQSRRLLHGLADVAAHPARAALAERLCALAPVSDPRVHFAVSGSDAVEVALKTAQLATGRDGILVFEGAYHGVSLGALAATSRPAFREPFAAALRPRVVRLPWQCDEDELTRALDEHGADLACVLVEPVLGREGVRPARPGWLSMLAGHCRAHGLVVAVDEIFTGFGRLGTLFAVAAEGLEPDLLCCGKALGGGLPIGAVIGRGDLMAAWDGVGEALHTGTFLAQPLACAAALAVLDILDEEGLVERAADLGSTIAATLEPLLELGVVTDCRGGGLLWGVELARPAAATTAIDHALGAGLLLLTSGPEGRVLEIVPPLVVTEAQLECSLDILSDAVAAADSEHE
ncbi:MAG: aspartate aminotransferase family protein [Thermoanaerobaculia bacterium]|nr:aspartate aminotransferase family protein [Thermoanaerobaculia bacterium]